MLPAAERDACECIRYKRWNRALRRKAVFEGFDFIAVEDERMAKPSSSRKIKPRQSPKEKDNAINKPSVKSFSSLCDLC